MAATGQAIAAMSAGNMAFHRDEIAFGKTFHMVANLFDHADKLVANGHRNGNRFLRPGIPVVNVNVGPADRCFEDADKHIVAFDFRDRNFFEPKPGFSPALYHRLHHFLHEPSYAEIAHAPAPARAGLLLHLKAV